MTPAVPEGSVVEAGPRPSLLRCHSGYRALPKVWSWKKKQLWKFQRRTEPGKIKNINSATEKHILFEEKNKTESKWYLTQHNVSYTYLYFEYIT